MRRDSTRARRIEALCASATPPVPADGRRLEGWGDDMLPLPGATDERIVAHIRELTDATERYRDRDTRAKVIAARAPGFPCDRLRTALLSSDRYRDVGPPVPALPDDGATGGRVEDMLLGDGETGGYEATLGASLPRAAGRRLRGQLRDMATGAVDGGTTDRDDPDAVHHDTMRALGMMSVGADETGAYADVLSDITGEPVNADAIRFGPYLARVCVESAPLELLSALAVYARGLGVDESEAAEDGPLLFASTFFILRDHGEPDPAGAIAETFGVTVPPEFASRTAAALAAVETELPEPTSEVHT